MNKLKSIPPSFLVFLALGLYARSAPALGTPAGTDISTQATVSYSIEGVGYTKESNLAETLVSELIDVNVVWQDTGSILVSPGDNTMALTFKVTNTGNGTETFPLSVGISSDRDKSAVTLAGLFLDSNGNSLYDPDVDALYTPNGNDPVLEADKSVVVFVRSTVAASISDTRKGNTTLTATSIRKGNAPSTPASKTGKITPGSIYEGAGDRGTDAVIGSSGGSANATGTYLVSDTGLSITTDVRTNDLSGGENPVTGATLAYSVTVTVSGSGTAEQIVVSDTIPSGTTYQGGTLSLNSVSLTDAADGDAGDVNVSDPGVITVNLGDLTAASPAQIVRFDVLIN